MIDLLEGLNPEQARAVQHQHGPLLILAGAGSGKTRVLTRRIAMLIAGGVRPWNIYAVTFTNKAAGEMKERVTHLVGPRGHDAWVSTFHASCVRILRRDIAPLGYTGAFAIWDDDDQGKVLKRILSDQKIDPKRHPPAKFRSAIDRAKNALKGPADIEEVPGDRLRAVFEAYEARLKAANALDFNDLINKVVELWEHHPDVLARWRDRFRYVMVDEYQDTNAAQYKLLRLLAGEHQNLAVVGDDDQSIYSFRGADIQNILSFTKDFPGATVVRLEQNYRSTQNILRAASAVVKNNSQRMEKTLRTEADLGLPLSLQHYPDDQTEADSVVATIRTQQKDRKFSEFAVIYRTNAQSRPFEKALAQWRIPYTLVGGRKFYERREVRDLLGYLRLVVNAADDMSFQRVINVPTRGLGEKALEGLLADAAHAGTPLLAAARHRAVLGGRTAGAFNSFVTLIDGFTARARLVSPGELVQHVAEATGYLAELRAEQTDEAQARIENIEELVRAAGDLEVDPDATPFDRLIAFMDRAALAGQADELPDDGTGAVTLLTAHLAKGLEYPVVFLVGMAEGCFPHSRAEREEDIEEERRLVYVAITRARERLYLSFPRSRRSMQGGWIDSVGSRFIEEIPPEVFGREPVRRETPSWLRGPPRPPAWSGRAAGRVDSAPPSPAPVAVRRTPDAPPVGSTWTRGSLPGPAAPRQAGLFDPSHGAEEERSVGRRMAPDSLESFSVGAEVYHPLLGAGTIQKRDGLSSNPRLTIHFRNHGPRTVFAVSARMEILLP